MHPGLIKTLKTVTHYQNWPTRLLENAHLLPARQLIRYQLRKGPTFLVRPYTSDSSCLQSITRDHEYFPYFRVMPGDTVVDIGANIGSFSVYVAHQEPAARVIAVEPVGANVELLRKNVAENKLENVAVVHAAVADHAGELTLYHGKDTWHASGSVFAIDATDQAKKETVPCVTLADLLRSQGVGRIDFLKMDCEGAEYQILFSLPDDIWKHIRKIALEYHNFVPGKSQQDLLTLLAAKGFRAVLPKKYNNKDIGLIFAIHES